MSQDLAFKCINFTGKMYIPNLGALRNQDTLVLKKKMYIPNEKHANAKINFTIAPFFFSRIVPLQEKMVAYSYVTPLLASTIFGPSRLCPHTITHHWVRELNCDLIPFCNTSLRQHNIICFGPKWALTAFALERAPIHTLQNALC